MAELDPEALAAEMTAWRRDLHAHPEFGFEECRTAALVAATLRACGLDEVVEGVGGTGVVGTLRRGRGNRAIALRADMDALRIAEAGTASYASRTPGVMHACGHDGHTAMLLGAAKLLAAEGGFDGTIRFVFQPAEEWGRGAQAMLDDGLLARFPFDEVYGLHNAPGLAVGFFETRPGPFMAAEDLFDIVLEGCGGHAAAPQETREVLVAACALVLDLQTIVSRRIAPGDAAVVSVTELVSDGARNVLPGTARIRGDVRSFRPEVGATVEREMRRIAEGIARAHAVSATVGYVRDFVPLANDPFCAGEMLSAARDLSGDAGARLTERPFMGSEDFARFLAHVPGAFGFIGNGESSPPLHNAAYDFADAALIHGARLHAAIARRRLPVA